MFSVTTCSGDYIQVKQARKFAMHPVFHRNKTSRYRLKVCLINFPSTSKHLLSNTTYNITSNTMQEHTFPVRTPSISLKYMLNWFG